MNENHSSINLQEKECNGKYYNPAVMSYIRDDWIKQQLDVREQEYTDYHNISIFCGTWNVNAKKAVVKEESSSLKTWLMSSDNVSFDMFAIGLQEIVDLNAVNVVVNNMSQSRSAQWEETIAEAIEYVTNHKFKIILSKHMVGILLMIFVKAEHAPMVKDIQSATAGVGVMGMMGNKGGVAIRMTFYHSSICFVSSHLAAHRENVNGRNSDFMNIVAKISFQDPALNSATVGGSESTNSGYSLLDHDLVIWLGDLNYHISEGISSLSVFSHVEAKDVSFLTCRDQGKVFKGFDEGPITFLPTYKYQPGTSCYEQRPDKKLRAPAWCDRILWKSLIPSNVRLLEYDRAELEISDHRPVKAIFSVKLKCHVEEKRNYVIRDIMHQLDKWENENMPKIKIDGSVVSFPVVQYSTPIVNSIWIENIGQVVAHFRFIPKLHDPKICKPWLSVYPAYGMIPPNDRMEIKIRIFIDNGAAHALTAGKDTLDDTMILRIESGRDYFVIVSGTYQMSSFGTSLEQLVLMTGAARDSSTGLSRENGTESPQKVPKELWRVVDDLYRTGIDCRGIFLESSNHIEIAGIRQALDCGTRFPHHSPHSMAETLILFLSSLRDPVLPPTLISNFVMDPSAVAFNAKNLLDGLSPVNYNVFVYLISFLREILEHSEKNRLTAQTLAYVFCGCLLSQPATVGKSQYTSDGTNDPDYAARNETVQSVLIYFLTTSSL